MAIDCKARYWQYPQTMDSISKIAFVYPIGLRKYSYVLMGLLTAPCKFMRYIDTIMAKSGLIISSKGFVDHLLSGVSGFHRYMG